MESYRLWRDVVEEVAGKAEGIQLTHLYADNCAFQMAMRPRDFDTVIGCNLMGDLLSDLAAIVSGGLGMLPSACLCGLPEGPVCGIYEPVHGAAHGGAAFFDTERTALVSEFLHRALSR